MADRRDGGPPGPGGRRAPRGHRLRQTHGGDLLPTIRTWLEHDRETHKAAQALHIHPNTLLYRVRRFEQITGRSLASTEALAETWLALRAAATLSSQ